MYSICVTVRIVMVIATAVTVSAVILVTARQTNLLRIVAATASAVTPATVSLVIPSRA